MYKNLTPEQSAKLAQSLGPEFTASAKNDLLNFADAVVGLVSPFDQKPKAKVEEKAEDMTVTKAKSK